MPAVNRLGDYGWSGFAELRSFYDFLPVLGVAIDGRLPAPEPA
jgi:hypothetical protein